MKAQLSLRESLQRPDPVSHTWLLSQGCFLARFGPVWSFEDRMDVESTPYSRCHLTCRATMRPSLSSGRKMEPLLLALPVRPKRCPSFIHPLGPCISLTKIRPKMQPGKIPELSHTICSIDTAWDVELSIPLPDLLCCIDFRQPQGFCSHQCAEFRGSWVPAPLTSLKPRFARVVSDLWSSEKWYKGVEALASLACRRPGYIPDITYVPR